MKSLIVLALLTAGALTPGARAMQPHRTGPTATVHFRNYAFSPLTITVAAGTTVEFVNDDGDAHTATADDKSFDSGALDTHETWRHRFTHSGTFAYFCALHPYMKGRIVVTAAK